MNPNTYEIGPLTMRLVFQENGIENVADWQSVMNAVEQQLKRQTDMINGMINGGNEMQVGWVLLADRLLKKISKDNAVD